MKNHQPTLPLESVEPSQKTSPLADEITRLTTRIFEAARQADSADTGSAPKPHDVLKKVKAQSPEERDVKDLAFLVLSVDDLYSSDQQFCNECNLLFKNTLDAWIVQVKGLSDDSTKEFVEALYTQLSTLAPCDESQASEYEKALEIVTTMLSCSPTP